MSEELCRESIASLAPRIEGREISPTELTQITLERIERLNPKLNAFLTVTAELALEQARGAEAEIAAGNYRGPLHGIPISLKDLYLTRGIRTTGGSKILGDWVPDIDSAVGERLRDAGSILVGKNHMHEFAFGTTNLNPHYGPALNPWSQDRVPGRIQRWHRHRCRHGHELYEHGFRHRRLDSHASRPVRCFRNQSYVWPRQ